ncbi:MAG: restriction endonuclease subunit S [Ignavibacteriales bacterium]|nr:restriction endonuclease subunit S [Ignavibacteriales bacterium]MCF8316884.1 restriction endonuclease subunit S [Ignavibacteriales bacterium]MCF8438445.1 restriction endonuclease subunit S [Ignavibacteriales bacterium]
MKWSHLPLEQFVDFYNGKSILPSEKGNFPAFGSNGIIGYSENYLYDKGIIIGRVGANCGSVEVSLNNFWPSDNTIVAKPKSNADLVFVYYLLKNYPLNSYAGGSAQPLLTQTVLKPIKFNIPEFPTQRRIASILSAYDDLIENNLKRIKLLEEKAFASYKLIVQNEKLEEFTIDELANVVMGQSPTSDTYTNEKEDNLPFHQGVTNFSNYFVEHKIYCKTPTKIAEDGDILFSVRAPVGRINFTSDKICIGRGLCAFRSKKGFQNYFYHQLKEFFFAEDVIGNGAIFNAVTKVELMKVKLKTPSDKIQQEFEAEAQQMYNLILNLIKQNAKLREARDILLPKLMNGQIEV